ncbi:MAG: bis-aminopropyl spermidine synthase family protein, partial [Gammaproteobacteria bacterium]
MDHDRDLGPTLKNLARLAGVDFIQVQRVLCALCEAGQAPIGWLVEATRVPHRTVVDTLRALHLKIQDDVAALPEEMHDELADLLRCHRLKWLDSVGRMENDPTLRDLMPLVEEISAGLPPSVWNLDHVPATTETKLRRALYLASHYELRASHLLCLGDHDLTSVVTKMIEPEVRVSVVDIDERLLEYLDKVSDRHGLAIHLAFGDLRVGLPISLQGSAALVFTDPPYTNEGIELFVRRALEGLASTPHARLLF